MPPLQKRPDEEKGSQETVSKQPPLTEVQSGIGKIVPKKNENIDRQKISGAGYIATVLYSVDPSQGKYTTAKDKLGSPLGTPIYYGNMQVYEKETRKKVIEGNTVRFVVWALKDEKSGNFYTLNNLDYAAVRDALYSSDNVSSAPSQKKIQIQEVDYSKVNSVYSAISAGSIPKDLESNYGQIRALLLLAFQENDSESAKVALSIAKEHWEEVSYVYTADTDFAAKWNVFASAHKDDFTTPLMDDKARVFGEGNLARTLESTINGLGGIIPAIRDGVGENFESGFLMGVGSTSLDLAKIIYNIVPSTLGAIETPIFGTHLSNSLMVGANEQTSWKTKEDLKGKIYATPSPQNMEAYGIMSNMAWVDTGLSAFVVGGAVAKILKKGTTSVIMESMVSKLGSAEGKAVVAQRLGMAVEEVTEKEVQQVAKDMLEKAAVKASEDMKIPERIFKGKKNPSMKSIVKNVNKEFELNDLGKDVIKTPPLVNPGEMLESIKTFGNEAKSLGSSSLYYLRDGVAISFIESLAPASKRLLEKVYLDMDRMISKPRLWYNISISVSASKAELAFFEAGFEAYAKKVPSATILDDGFKTFMSELKAAKGEFDGAMSSIGENARLQSESAFFDKSFGKVLGEETGAFKKSFTEGIEKYEKTSYTEEITSKLRSFKPAGLEIPSTGGIAELALKIDYVPVHDKLPFGGYKNWQEYFNFLKKKKVLEPETMRAIDGAQSAESITDPVKYAGRRKKLNNLLEKFDARLLKAEDKLKAFLERNKIDPSISTYEDVRNHITKTFDSKYAKTLNRELKALESQFNRLAQNRYSVSHTLENMQNTYTRTIKFGADFAFYNASLKFSGAKNVIKDGFTNLEWIENNKSKYMEYLSKRDVLERKIAATNNEFFQTYKVPMSSLGSAERKKFAKTLSGSELEKFNLLGESLSEAQKHLAPYKSYSNQLFNRVAYDPLLKIGTAGTVAGLGTAMYLYPSIASALVPPLLATGGALGGLGIMALDALVAKWAFSAGKRLDPYFYPTFHRLMALETVQKQVTTEIPKIGVISYTGKELGFSVDANYSQTSDSKVLGVVLTLPMKDTGGNNIMMPLFSNSLTKDYKLEITGGNLQAPLGIQLSTDGTLLFAGVTNAADSGTQIRLPNIEESDNISTTYGTGGNVILLSPGTYTLNYTPSEKMSDELKSGQTGQASLFTFTVNPDMTVTKPVAVKAQEPENTPPEVVTEQPVKAPLQTGNASVLVDSEGRDIQGELTIQKYQSYTLQIKDVAADKTISPNKDKDGTLKSMYKIYGPGVKDNPDGSYNFSECENITKVNSNTADGNIGLTNFDKIGRYVIIPFSYTSQDINGTPKPGYYSGKPLIINVIEQDAGAPAQDNSGPAAPTGQQPAQKSADEVPIAVMQANVTIAENNLKNKKNIYPNAYELLSGFDKNEHELYFSIMAAMGGKKSEEMSDILSELDNQSNENGKNIKYSSAQKVLDYINSIK